MEASPAYRELVKKDFTDTLTCLAANRVHGECNENTRISLTHLETPAIASNTNFRDRCTI